MRAISHHVHGTLFVEDGRAALLLKDATPAVETVDSLYLRYAFVTQGKEESILPAFVLDDWGREIKSLNLYEWVRAHGDQFPRAEMFGLTLAGQETQHFLRDLELHVPLRCYVYPTRMTAVAFGIAVAAVLIPGVTVAPGAPQRIKRPPEIEQPLRFASVSWWYVSPDFTEWPHILSEFT